MFTRFCLPQYWTLVMFLCTSWCVFLVKEQDVSLIHVGYLGCLVVWGMCETMVVETTSSTLWVTWNNGNVQLSITGFSVVNYCSFYCKCVMLLLLSYIWIYYIICTMCYIYLYTCFFWNIDAMPRSEPIFMNPPTRHAWQHDRPPRNEQPAAPSNCFGPWMNLGSLEL